MTKLAKGTDQELEVKESKAAKRLSRTVNKMIVKMDMALSELEKKEVAKKEVLTKDESQLTRYETIITLTPQAAFTIFCSIIVICRTSHNLQYRGSSRK